jgi:hypothetical protein
MWSCRPGSGAVTDQYFRALDAVAAATQATEQHLNGALCDLANLHLRLVCYHCGVPAERDQGRGEGGYWTSGPAVLTSGAAWSA